GEEVALHRLDVGGQPGGLAYLGESAVRADHQPSPDVGAAAVLTLEDRAAYLAALLNQGAEGGAGDIGVVGEVGRRGVEDADQGRLRDVDRQRAEREAAVVDVEDRPPLHAHADSGGLQEAVFAQRRAEAELAEGDHGGGGQRLAAEFALQVGLLLHHDDVDAAPREQAAEQRSGRAAADDEDLGLPRHLIGTVQRAGTQRAHSLPQFSSTFFVAASSSAACAPSSKRWSNASESVNSGAIAISPPRTTGESTIRPTPNPSAPLIIGKIARTGSWPTEVTEKTPCSAVSRSGLRVTAR